MTRVHMGIQDVHIQASICCREMLSCFLLSFLMWYFSWITTFLFLCVVVLVLLSQVTSVYILIRIWRMECILTTQTGIKDRINHNSNR